MPNVATFTKPVVDALRLKTGAERRAALRKLATAEFEQWMPQVQQELIAGCGWLNPSNQTWPAVRDKLPIGSLFNMATGVSGPLEWVAASKHRGGTFPLDGGGSMNGDLMNDIMKAMITGLANGAAPQDIVDAAETIAMGHPTITVSFASDAFDDQTTNSQPMETPMAKTATSTKTLPQPTGDQRRVLDTILASFGGGATFADIEQILAEKDAEIVALGNRPGGVQITLGQAAMAPIPSTNSLPNGNVVLQKAHQMFGIAGAAMKVFDFDVPTFDWDAPHPMVPDLDPDYVFEPDTLLGVLTSLLFNTKTWVYGHTGTGKTTLIEQVASRLSWPVIRLNFDSEISRLDMIGRDVIKVDPNGHTITEFVDGVLPQAMQMPVILLCDEMDFIRPDVAYVMQRALENKGLLITEDGGRLIQPHAHFRIFATANTKGAGDDTGRYMGARPQSGAFLNRFTNWIGVDYMKPDQLATLIVSKTGIDQPTAKVLGNYAKEHWRGFEQNDLMQDLSARNITACAEQYHFFKGLMPADKALEKAFEKTIFNRAATAHDAQTMKGIFQRVVK